MTELCQADNPLRSLAGQGGIFKVFDRSEIAGNQLGETGLQVRSYSFRGKYSTQLLPMMSSILQPRNLAPLSIRQGNSAFGVQSQDHDTGNIQELFCSIPFLEDRLLRPLAVGDITHNRHRRQ